MKKKLLLLITCFLLFFSLVISLTHRNIHLSEIAKNKEEEVKRLLKQLKEQKESNSNQNNHQKETDDDLPWLFTFVGAIIDLIISMVIPHIIVRYNQKLKEKKNRCEWRANFFFTSIAVFLYITVFPPLFAIQKYKNKSYWERLKLIEKNFFVFIAFAIISSIIILFFDSKI